MLKRRASIPADIRFFKLIEKSHSGCWEWVGGKTSGGYGRFCLEYSSESGISTFVDAHRASWKIFRGDIPEGLCVLHKCDVKACVNPDHLFLGTLKDNTQDMLRKGRAKGPCANNARKTHCLRGHELTEDNLVTQKSRKGRRCKACTKVYREKNKCKNG